MLLQIELISKLWKQAFKDIEVKMHKNNQSYSETQGSLPKAEQKVYSAFANILQQYQTNKSQNEGHSQNLDQKQSSHSNADNNSPSKEAADEAESNLAQTDQKEGNFKIRKLTVASEDQVQVLQTAHSQVNQRPKKLIKKSGKRTLQNETATPSKNKLYDQTEVQTSSNLRQKGSFKNNQSIEIVQSDREQRLQENPEQIIQQSRINSGNRTSSTLPQLMKIKPQIHVYAEKRFTEKDKRGAQALLQTSTKAQSINFLIEIRQLSSRESAINSRSNTKYSAQKPSKTSHPLDILEKTPNQFIQTRKKDREAEEYYWQPPQPQNKSNQMAEFYQQAQEQSRQNVWTKQKNRQMVQTNRKVEFQAAAKPPKKTSFVSTQKNSIAEAKRQQLQKSTISLSEGSRQPQNYFNALKNRNEPMNTGNASLKDLVKELFKRKIINQTLYNEFVQNHSLEDIKDYISKFNGGKLQKFDFNKIKFTILDHRRISQILVNLYHDHYFIGICYHSDPQILDFLNRLYQLSADEYYDLYTKIDNISLIKWWSKMLIANDQRLMEVHKERRLARRKAEQASLEVKQFVQKLKARSMVSDTNQSVSSVGLQNENSRPPHRTFFGHSEQTKANLKRRRQQQQQLLQIRNMVTNNFSVRPQQTQESNSNKMVMRKKIKFY